MDIEELEDIAREIGAVEGQDQGLNSLLTKLGQYSSISVDKDMMTDEEYSEAMGDCLAGFVMIISHMAVEEGINLDSALEERTDMILENVRERKEKQQTISEAMRDGDFKSVARHMGFVDKETNTNDNTRFYQ